MVSERALLVYRRALHILYITLNLAIVAANNHYAGFGPGTANTSRKMLDLSEVTWNDVVIPNTGENASRNTKQTSLSDFLK